MILRLPLLLCCLPLSLALSSPAEQPHKQPERTISSRPPLQADLLAPLDIGKLALGSPVLTKARVDWSSPACHIRAGSVVAGRVIEIQKHSKDNKSSSISILFDQADCNGQLSPIAFNIFAIVTTPPPDEGIAMVDQGGIFRVSAPSVHMGMGGGAATGGPSSTPPLDPGSDMSVQNRKSATQNPSVILPGQVIGAKNISLAVGTGPSGSSTLSTPKGNIRFEGATQLVLMPKPEAPTPSTEEAKATPPPPPPPPEPAFKLPSPPPPLPDETSICTDPCSEVPASTHPGASHADHVLSTAKLGFIPHDRREFTSLDYESTVTFLDGAHLLYTFDPHKIRQHVPLGFRAESVRTIRAVLLDPATFKIKKITDWQVRGEDRYIWHAGPGHILVHLGQKLVLLNPDLTIQREFPIPGHLAFVSVAPSGGHIAIGVLHERYTRQMHDLLATSLDAEPEEDIDVTLLDQNLAPILTARQSSTQPQPVLSDNGEIRLHYASTNRWSISETRWDRSTHNIATFNSECNPTLSTPFPESVFIVGCAKSPLHNWYRMLRLDGHPILKGEGSSQEIAQSSSSDSENEFAVRVIHTRSSKSFTDTFFKDDLSEQQITVYRNTNGKRLMLITDREVSLAQQSFALSPSGRQIAILSSDSLSLYKIDPAAH